MKRLVYLLAGTVLLSFTKHRADDIDGIWMGYYRSEMVKEKVIVKFSSQDRMEFYTGGVDDRTKCIGSYRLLGDSVSFTYTTPDGQQFRMQGHLNYRKTYLDGVWKTNDRSTGKFYLERQKVEERFIEP
jgi:hypothetical protein